MSSHAEWVAGVDIGGTFTDVVLLDRIGGTLWNGKVLTTPRDPADGVRQALQQAMDAAKLTRGELQSVVHGTTLVINAIIERRGVRTGFVTTAGFEDMLHLRRESRYDVFDLSLELPKPLVNRRDVHGITARMRADGSVLEPIDDDAKAALLAWCDEIRGRGIGSVAVCLLHAYANPEHEETVREIIAGALPGVTISTSHEILSEWREYERACATVMNAYTQPVTRRYIENLDTRFGEVGVAGPWYVMATNGGVVTPAVAAQKPIRILESGPVGGALGAGYAGKHMGRPDVIAFDMGGTTAKVCVIENGLPLVTTDYEVARVRRPKPGSGLPVRLPVIDMIEIGAGGGSIGHVDQLGLLQVGPESASSEPGPACYGRGGLRPTVTDANLFLGYLDADNFNGGQFSLDVGAAERALTTLGKELGTGPEDAAWGIISIVSENMSEAMRVHTIERGIDCRELTMVAFGGAGPMHGYTMARSLGIQTVVFPPSAGVLSAFGFITAPLSFDVVRTHVTELERLEYAQARDICADMHQEAVTTLLGPDGDASEFESDYWADMRYVGQGHEIKVHLGRSLPDESSLRQELLDRFGTEYKGRYGRELPHLPVEIINWRCRITGPAPTVHIAAPMAAAATATGAGAGKTRAVYLGPELGRVDCAVHSRYALAPGVTVAGPALIEERECTLFVGPDATAEVDALGMVVMTIPS